MSDLLLAFAELCFPGDEDKQEELIDTVLAGDIRLETTDMRDIIVQPSDGRQPLAGELFDKGHGFSLFMARNRTLAIRHMEQHPVNRVALEWFAYSGEHPGTFVRAMLEDWGAAEIADVLEGKVPN